MRKRIEMSRLSLHVPTTLYDRIDTDSKRYGISKTALVQTMIVNYYRSIDKSSAECSRVAVCQGASRQLRAIRRRATL